jgi:hypothetical protein
LFTVKPLLKAFSIEQPLAGPILVSIQRGI